jgi:hypothetical protein
MSAPWHFYRFRLRSLLNSQAFVNLLTSCSAGTRLFAQSRVKSNRARYDTHAPPRVGKQLISQSAKHPLAGRRTNLAWFDLGASKFRLRYPMKTEISALVKQKEIV